MLFFAETQALVLQYLFVIFTFTNFATGKVAFARDIFMWHLTETGLLKSPTFRKVPGANAAGVVDAIKEPRNSSEVLFVEDAHLLLGCGVDLTKELQGKHNLVVVLAFSAAQLQLGTH